MRHVSNCEEFEKVCRKKHNTSVMEYAKLVAFRLSFIWVFLSHFSCLMLTPDE